MIRAPSVTIVVNTFNQNEFLTDALASCMAQSVPATALVVVDDGSRDNPAAIVSRFPRATLIRHPNRGLAASRNAALAVVDSEFVIFLDADDRLTPVAIEAGLNCMARHADAAMCYGAFRLIDAEGFPISRIRVRSLGARPHETLVVRSNLIGMHGTVLYDRAKLVDLGGFDETLQRCEDYDLYLRMTQRWPIAHHRAFVAEYRRHGSNMSGDLEAMYRTLSLVLDRHVARHPDLEPLRKAGRRAIRPWYAGLRPVVRRILFGVRRNLRRLAGFDARRKAR